jgi:hypothetical protein
MTTYFSDSSVRYVTNIAAFVTGVMALVGTLKLFRNR